MNTFTFIWSIINCQVFLLEWDVRALKDKKALTRMWYDYNILLNTWIWLKTHWGLFACVHRQYIVMTKNTLDEKDSSGSLLSPIVSCHWFPLHIGRSPLHWPAWWPLLPLIAVINCQYGSMAVWTAAHSRFYCFRWCFTLQKFWSEASCIKRDQRQVLWNLLWTNFSPLSAPVTLEYWLWDFWSVTNTSFKSWKNSFLMSPGD